MRLRIAEIVATLVALMPLSLARAESPTAANRPADAAAAAVPRFQLRSEHFIFGMPRCFDDRHQIVDKRGDVLPGISVLVREGFVVGHYDRFKVPAWVSTHWTRADYRASEAEPYNERRFAPDHELPLYARAETSYDYATSKMQRGHMARQQDNKAWGSDNVLMGCRMSNIVPQSGPLNGGIWGEIEDETRSVVANPASKITSVWIISGPVFRRAATDAIDTPLMTVGNGVGVPWSTYKVVGWFDADDRFNVRAFIARQRPIATEPEQCLTTVDEVEALTGLDFFPELDDRLQVRLESQQHETLWR